MRKFQILIFNFQFPFLKLSFNFVYFIEIINIINHQSNVLNFYFLQSVFVFHFQKKILIHF